MYKNQLRKILNVLFLSSTVLLTSTSFAQSSNNSYVPLQVSNEQAVANPVEGKPLVVEFFWYGCPHCYHMEPLVKKLIADRRGDFTFKRYPVVLPRWESGARLFFTLEEMGLADKLHDKVFNTIQEQHLNIMDKKDLRDKFLQKEGVDVAKFDGIYNSFGMNAKLNRAKTFIPTYKIDSSPAFVIDNSYLVTPGLTGSYDATITQVNKLLDIEKSKQAYKVNEKKSTDNKVNNKKTP